MAIQNEVFWRWLKTVAVLLAMMNAGMKVGIFSTTFPDMALFMSVTNGQMATTMTWMGLSSIVGTLCMGPLFDRFDGLLLLSCVILLQGLAIGLAPWWRILIVFDVMAAISSIFSAGTNAGGVAVISIIWKKKSEMLNPIIQLTAFSFAFGTAITPQLIAPFIGTHQLPDIISPTATPNGSNASSFFGNANLDFVASNSTTANSSCRYEGPEPVQIAFSLVACINVLTAVVCFVICAFDRWQMQTESYEYRVNVRSRSYSLNEDGRTIVDEEFIEERPRERTASLDRLVLQKKFKDERARRGDQAKPGMLKLLLNRQELQQRKDFCSRNDENSLETATVNPHGHGIMIIGHSVPPVTCSWKITPLVIIVFLFFCVCGGTDAMFGGLLYTFLNGYLHWTPQDGILLVTIYQVTNIVIHAVVVLLARFLSPVVLFVMDIIFLVVSSGLMLATVNANPVFTWIAVILTGFATSNIHPTAITHAKDCFQVDGKVMGIVFSAVFIGMSVVSPIVGLLLDSYGVISFPVVLMSITVLEVVLFALWLVVARTIRGHQAVPPVEEIVIQNERTPLIGR